MKRIVWLSVAALIAAILFYVSRFWSFSLWPRSGLFGIEELRPQGDLVGQWLRGTDFAPFELLIWAVGAFLVLTVLQKLYDRLNPPPE
ncbi:hypothetical protein [Tateyamaria sp.]|uniref:hypothetical protein n=1 Tax=Tateyamaria sp. TaxID=1929288 RepID=UPI003B21D905